MEITIPAPYLQAAALAAADKKDIREYLQGVCLRKNGYIAATNGHILVRFALPELTALENDVIIPIAVVQAALKALPKVAKHLCPAVTVVVSDNGCALLPSAAASYGFTPLQGRYPDVERVIPDVKMLRNPFANEQASPNLALEYRTIAHKVGKLIGPVEPLFVEQKEKPRASAVCVYYPGFTPVEAIMIIMPKTGTAGLDPHYWPKDLKTWFDRTSAMPVTAKKNLA